ncbi:hypothetical protein HDIA_3420 [Hartmannibacter diazotrophicus]|uniref:DUF1116 domain-containing protein n=1 Tax=Hartmannibacter diazotrophicus TaxID=1482074 RepID=A0A2C9DB45_9HYPH|nr:DUF1116 domain-containing protein [Hartmannibacter diazotrophicus]SON56961.1 hypothetical protein HDIA_3420 [Hartmannibacter diazotrophicus]
MTDWQTSPATLSSFERLVAARPQWTETAPLKDLIDLPARTLLHAGPPFADPGSVAIPVLISAAVAAVLEGWVADVESARSAILAGELALMPAQDFGVVTPLAFVVGPGTWCLKVEDEAGKAPGKISPLNDGPATFGLRFGTGNPDGIAYVRRVGETLGPALRDAMTAPIPVLPIMTAGLAGGDELHGRVSSANDALMAALPILDETATADLRLANQFVLNLLMAGTAVMLAAAAGVPGSSLVVAAGGNGVDLGWKRADAPDQWITMPAAPPVGPRMKPDGDVLPAIGDSAVLDACGFGAASLRFCPDLLAALGDLLPPVCADPEAHAAFVGPHPAFAIPGLRLGLDADCPAPRPGIMLAMLDAGGHFGLLGRGVAPWPNAAR